MIQGLRTVVYPVNDLDKGKAWYGRVLEREPYFDEPFYVGYSVGGFELGLIPDGSPGSQGSHAFWGIPDLDAELVRLTALGAEIYEPANDVGGGIRVASLKDPFGNVFGLIENPNFDLNAVR